MLLLEEQVCGQPGEITSERVARALLRATLTLVFVGRRHALPPIAMKTA